MHRGDEMPILNEHAALRQIILTMSSKMLGCVGIVNEKRRTERDDYRRMTCVVHNGQLA